VGSINRLTMMNFLSGKGVGKKSKSSTVSTEPAPSTSAGTSETNGDYAIVLFLLL
jgi:hypothetical protein